MKKVSTLRIAGGFVLLPVLAAGPFLPSGFFRDGASPIQRDLFRSEAFAPARALYAGAIAIRSTVIVDMDAREQLFPRSKQAEWIPELAHRFNGRSPIYLDEKPEVVLERIADAIEFMETHHESTVEARLLFVSVFTCVRDARSLTLRQISMQAAIGYPSLVAVASGKIVVDVHATRRIADAVSALARRDTRKLPLRSAWFSRAGNEARRLTSSILNSAGKITKAERLEMQGDQDRELALYQQQQRYAVRSILAVIDENEMPFRRLVARQLGLLSARDLTILLATWSKPSNFDLYYLAPLAKALGARIGEFWPRGDLVEVCFGTPSEDNLVEGVNDISSEVDPALRALENRLTMIEGDVVLRADGRPVGQGSFLKLGKRYFQVKHIETDSAGQLRLIASMMARGIAVGPTLRFIGPGAELAEIVSREDLPRWKSLGPDEQWTMEEPVKPRVVKKKEPYRRSHPEPIIPVAPQPLWPQAPAGVNSELAKAIAQASSDFIQRRMKAKSWHIVELAQASGINKTRIPLLTTGRMLMTPVIGRTLAAAFGEDPALFWKNYVDALAAVWPDSQSLNPPPTWGPLPLPGAYLTLFFLRALNESTMNTKKWIHAVRANEGWQFSESEAYLVQRGTFFPGLDMTRDISGPLKKNPEGTWWYALAELLRSGGVDLQLETAEPLGKIDVPTTLRLLPNASRLNLFITEWIDDHGISRGWLANKKNVSHAQLSAIENREELVEFAMAARLSDATGFPLDLFWCTYVMWTDYHQNELRYKSVRQPPTTLEMDTLSANKIRDYLKNNPMADLEEVAQILGLRYRRAVRLTESYAIKLPTRSEKYTWMIQRLIEQFPTYSVAQLARATGLRWTSVERIIKRAGLHPRAIRPRQLESVSA